MLNKQEWNNNNNNNNTRGRLSLTNNSPMTMFTLTEKMGVEINSDSPAGNNGEIGYQVIKYRLTQ